MLNFVDDSKDNQKDKYHFAYFQQTSGGYDTLKVNIHLLDSEAFALLRLDMIV